MTTHPDDDELSGHLDGMADEHVAPHVRHCDVCEARLDVLAGAAAAVALQPPVDDDVREGAIATALAAASGGAARWRTGRPGRWRAAGLAAAGLLAIAATGIASLTRSDGEGGADVAAELRSDAAPVAGREEEAPAAAGGAAPATGRAGPTWLGELGDLDGGVPAALDRAAARGAGPTAAATGSPPPVCEVEARAAGATGVLASHGVGRLRGAAVTVLVFDDGGRGRAAVVSLEGCRVLEVGPAR